MAQKFGVKGWAQTFIFGSDGKLKFVDNRPSAFEFQEHLRALVPAIGRDDFILQDDEIIKPE